MTFFNFRKKQKNKEEQTEMTTLEQVKKAYADLSEDDKKSFHQSIKDRVDESVGQQEHLDGRNEDSQTAKDRVDEAEGEERAIEERREDRHEERQNERDERHDDRIDELFKKFDELSAKLDALTRDPKPVSKDTGDELDKLVQKYSN